MQVPDPADSSQGSARALALALLGYFLAVTLLITLAPFRFHWPIRIDLLWIDDAQGTLANVLLFLPLGFLYRLLGTSGAGGSIIAALFWGLGISAGIEILQLLLPGRFTSPMDVLANGSGAWIGARLHDRMQMRVRAEWVGRLALELPLMNVVYLLLPLLWLNGLASSSNMGRRLLALPLGISGSLILGGIYRHRFKLSRRSSVHWLPIGSAVWFVIGLLPGFMGSPWLGLGGAVLIAATTWLGTAFPLPRASDRRRFEIPLLKRVWPIFTGYLLLSSLWPVPLEYVSWRGAWAFSEIADLPGTVPILQLMEHFAAFTLLGYMVAESHGRQEVRWNLSVQWTLFWCGLAAGLLEVARGVHPEHIASLARGLLGLVASAYGAVIYWLQLWHIQQLTGRVPQRV